MLCATGVIAAALRPADATIADTVILDYAQRTTPGIKVSGSKGGSYEIALARPARLRTDDLLQLEDGTFLEVVAAPEPLIEVRAADLPSLARLAWQLGDRHAPVQILPNRLRVQREAAIEALLKASGAKVTAIEAPFDPEGGAYESSHAHRHEHHHRGQGHHHGHDHAHHDHEHDHGHGDGHGHGHDHGHAHRHGHRHD